VEVDTSISLAGLITSPKIEDATMLKKTPSIDMFLWIGPSIEMFLGIGYGLMCETDN